MTIQIINPCFLKQTKNSEFYTFSVSSCRYFISKTNFGRIYTKNLIHAISHCDQLNYSYDYESHFSIYRYYIMECNLADIIFPYSVKTRYENWDDNYD